MPQNHLHPPILLSLPRNDAELLVPNPASKSSTLCCHVHLLPMLDASRSSPPSVLLQTPFLMPLRLPELPQSLSDIILDTGACRYQRLRAPHSAIFSCLYLSLLAISLFSRSQISFDVLYILVPLKMYHVLNSRNPFEFI
jgi:hypothetical protein